MYIVFNEKGVGDLYYYAEPLPEEHKKNQYIEIDEKDIPEKEGYISKAKLVDGKLEWEFEEIIEPINPEEEILKLKKELEDKNKTISQLKTELSVLSDTVDFLIVEGDEAND